MNTSNPLAALNLSPAATRMLMVTAALLVASALLFLAVLQPTRTRIARTRGEIETRSKTLTAMRDDIAGAPALTSQLAEATSRLEAVRSRGVLVPYQNSYDMRGRELLVPLARQAGFTLLSTRELPPLPLQRSQKDPPERLYFRQPVEFTGEGSYEQIARFIALTEAAQPLATLCGLAVLGQQQRPEVHRAIITFEWPALSDKPTPAPNTKNAKKK